MNEAEHQGQQADQADWAEVEDAAALFKLATILFGPRPSEDEADQAEGSAA